MGSVPSPPSKVIWWGGELALGGFSLSESAPWEEDVVEVATWGAARDVLLLLKTCPSAESPSSSEGTTTTLLPLSRGAGSIGVSASARGMVAMGGAEFGGKRAGGDADGGGCWGQRVGEVGVVSKVGGMESPTPFAEASPLDFRIWVSLNLCCLSIFESAPRR